MKELSIIPVFSERDRMAEYAEQNNLCFEYNDFILPKVLCDRERTRELIKGYLTLKRDRSRDTMHGAFFDVTVFSYDKEIADISVKRMHQSMEIARELSLRGVVFHGNYSPFLRRETYDKRWLDKTAEVVHRLSAEFPEISIFMENMFDDSPDMLLKLSKELASLKNFGLCFDYAHAMLAGEKPEEWFSAFSPYLMHIHINDHCFAGDVHMVPGDGKTDWAEYQKLANQYAKGASVLCEVSGFESARRSINFLKTKSYYPF